MIVRDAAADLPRCLASARGVVDEIVVADTGSRDNTRAVAREMGARVLEIPWRDDFAEARNAALAACQADWILMLDADERLDPAAAFILHALMRRPGARLGYEAHIRNYINSVHSRLFARGAQPNDGRLPEAARYPAYLEHENVRFFRRHPAIHFTGRVHETVARTIEALGEPIGPPSFIIHHFGLAADAATRHRKDRYYLELGRKKLAERPEDPRSHFELAIELLEHANAPEQALALLEQACAMAPTFWAAWFYLGLARQRLGRAREALEAFGRARAGGLETGPLAASMGEAYYALGEFGAARRELRHALQMQPESASFASQLGLCEVRDGDGEAGLKRLRRAARSEPANPEVQDRLILALAWLGRTGEAAAAAESWLERSAAPTAKAYLRAASLWARGRQWPEAAAAIRRGLERFPNEPALCAAWSEVQPHLSPGLSQKPRLEA